MNRLSVPDMTCGHCKASVEAAIRRVDGTAEVRIDLTGHTVEVETAAPEAALIAALAEVGFPATAA